MTEKINSFEQSAFKLAPTQLRGKIRAAGNTGFASGGVIFL